MCPRSSSAEAQTLTQLPPYRQSSISCTWNSYMAQFLGSHITGGDLMTIAREVDTIVEALRATREAATVARGLQQFRKALRGDSASLTLAAFLGRSPRCNELHRLWDAPIVVRLSQTRVHKMKCAVRRQPDMLCSSSAYGWGRSRS